ncbi:hypothetical protein IAI18_17750 [Acetobacteraceae bacterium H6797]|nr:hypothetical protein [Acetobacteraceae bacterium H6797]
MSRLQPLPASALPPGAFRTSARMRFGDCDPAGIVFFPNWFKLANEAVEDFYGEGLKVDFHMLHGPRGIGTNYVHADADFFAPGMMGDVVHLTPIVTKVGGASYATTMHVHRGEQELLRMHFVNVTTSLAEKRAIPLPDDLRTALIAYQTRCQPELTP